MKNKTCLDPILTSQGGAVPGPHCQQGLCFHFLGLSLESGGALRSSSLWHISCLPSPRSEPRDEMITRLVPQQITGRWQAPLVLFQLVLVSGITQVSWGKWNSFASFCQMRQKGTWVDISQELHPSGNPLLANAKGVGWVTYAKGQTEKGVPGSHFL